MPHFEHSAMTLLLVQMAAILFVARTIGFVTRWLGQPFVIAEVIAGIVLGPSLLGWLWPGAMNLIFPAASLSVLRMLSQIGLVLFMFLIGLELDPKLLKGRAHTSIAISHTSIAVPFALGAAAAFWLYDSYAPPGVQFLSFLLFLGAAMSVTAFPVLARILSERHLLMSRVGAIAIACAAVDDVTAWCILAFVVAVARAQGIAQAAWTTAFALAYIVGMLVLVRPFLQRIGARVANREGLTPTVIALTLLLLLVSSTITELIGIHALFGAFIFGAVLPKEGKLAETLADKLETAAVVLLLPLFFAYSGLRTEIGLIRHPQEWLVTGAIILIATVGKFGGGAVAARLTGLRFREACAIGILMNTRGLMELIVLNIGMDLGVISPTLFTMLVIMALVTTFATTPVLQWVYPDRELAKERMVQAPVSQSPDAEQATLMMCVSDATAGPAMLAVAAALGASREPPTRLFALHIWNTTDRPSVELRRSDADWDIGPLGPLLGRARELKLETRTLEFASSAPARDIVRVSVEKRATLVLLGAHKPLLLEGRLGGIVGDVIAHSKCPVAVLVNRGLCDVKRVLVAFAGGPEDQAALGLARQIGRSPGTTLTLIHVVPPGELGRTGRGREQIAEAMVGLVEGQQEQHIETASTPVDQSFGEPEFAAGAITVRIVENDSPPDAVLAESRLGYDLVVLGMHAGWGLEAGMLSLRRHRVLSEATVSILAVHPQQRSSMSDA